MSKFFYNPKTCAFGRYTGQHLDYDDKTFDHEGEVKDDTNYFIVVVSYTTGDTFGRYPETYYSIVDLFEKEEDAVELATFIRKHEREANAHRSPLSWEERHSPQFKGKKYYAPWIGYFECLEGIEVCPVRLGTAVRRKF